MPKLKTRKAVSKRIRITKRKKVKIPKAFRGHLLTCKNRKRKRQLKSKAVLSGIQARKLRLMVHK